MSRDISRSVLQAIERPSLREMAVQQMRKAIERGELTAGQRVTELVLAKSLGVGQATVREALVDLEYQGFIERRGPRQTHITALTQKQINDIYAVRLRLETLAVELLVASHRPDLAAADREYRNMECAAELADYAEFYRADLEFHRALWRATGNQSLSDVLERLVPRLFAFGVIQHARPAAADLVATALTHGTLLELIRSQKSTEAADLMMDSMQTAWVSDTQLPDR